MKINLVSYANHNFIRRQKKLSKSALKFGVDKVYSYTEDMIRNTEFYKQNKKILRKDRGAGYWIWKPYIILDVLNKMNKGDILFYVDAGAEVVSDVKPLVKLCRKQNGILLFNGINLNKYWTKKECFIKMDCDSDKYWNSPQVMGGYQVYMKNDKSIYFLYEYLKFIQISDIVDDSKRTYLSNLPGFIEHRHDQSILTNLAIKYNIKGFRNPSQGGNHLKEKTLRINGEVLNHPYSDKPDYDSKYPTIFFNRRNSSDFNVILRKLFFKLGLNKIRGLEWMI